MRRLGVPNRSWRLSRRREIEFPNLGDVLTRDPETDFEKQRRLDPRPWMWIVGLDVTDREPWPHIQRADALDSSRFGRAPFMYLSHPCPLGRASDCDTGWADYLMSAASARPRAHAHARPPLAARPRTADTKSCPAVTRHQHLVAGESGCVREGPVTSATVGEAVTCVSRSNRCERC